MFSHKRKSSPETYFDREGISSGRPPVRGKGETFFRFSDPEEAARLVLEEQRDIIYSQKQNLKSQECQVDLLNTSTREFQRQVPSNRLEMYDVNHGYEESRRVQARFHEELARWDKALRETHIRSIHEVEELKGAQEMRIDEISRNELRERVTLLHRSSDHKHKSYRKEVIIWMILEKNQDVESICSGKVTQQLFQILVECWAATKVCDLKHGLCLVHRETFLTVYMQ